MRVLDRSEVVFNFSTMATVNVNTLKFFHFLNENLHWIQYLLCTNIPQYIVIRMESIFCPKRCHLGKIWLFLPSESCPCFTNQVRRRGTLHVLANITAQNLWPICFWHMKSKDSNKMTENYLTDTNYLIWCDEMLNVPWGEITELTVHRN